MKNIFSSIINNIVSPILKVSRQTSLKLLKIEIARCRIKVVKNVRKVFLSGISILLLLSLFTSGFLMLIATAFIIVKVKIGLATATVCLFFVGSACCLFSICLLSIISSEKMWVKYSGCDSVLDDVFAEK